MDVLNSYGVRLLMPFSGRWFYGDALYIVDPWLYLAAGRWDLDGRESGPRASCLSHATGARRPRAVRGLHGRDAGVERLGPCRRPRGADARGPAAGHALHGHASAGQSVSARGAGRHRRSLREGVHLVRARAPLPAGGLWRRERPEPARSRGRAGHPARAGLPAVVALSVRGGRSDRGTAPGAPQRLPLLGCGRESRLGGVVIGDWTIGGH